MPSDDLKPAVSYFHMRFSDAHRMLEAAWQVQDWCDRPRTTFHVCAVGSSSCVWTTNADAQELFRTMCKSHKIDFQERDHDSLSAGNPLLQALAAAGRPTPSKEE